MTETTDPGTDIFSNVTMSTAVLKALAHPLRRRILNTLSATSGGARAADLAERLGLPANKLSFHLRVLADAGLVQEAPELARDKRDRFWRHVSGSRTLGSPEHPAEDMELAKAVLAGVVADNQDVLRRVAAWAPAYTSGTDPHVRGNLTEASFRMSRDRFKEFITEMSVLLDRYREIPGDMSDADRATLIAWDLVIIAASEEI